MTDNEIIKALECCNRNGSCSKCPYDRASFEHEPDCASAMTADALDLINRQKAEIERLENSLAISKKETRRYAAQYQTIRSDVAKEFAEELKKDISWHRTEMFMNGLKGTPRTHEITYECVEEYIDNLVKEFTEGDSE